MKKILPLLFMAIGYCSTSTAQTYTWQNITDMTYVESASTTSSYVPYLQCIFSEPYIDANGKRYISTFYFIRSAAQQSTKPLENSKYNNTGANEITNNLESVSFQHIMRPQIGTGLQSSSDFKSYNFNIDTKQYGTGTSNGSFDVVKFKDIENFRSRGNTSNGFPNLEQHIVSSGSSSSGLIMNYSYLTPKGIRKFFLVSKAGFFLRVVDTGHSGTSIYKRGC